MSPLLRAAMFRAARTFAQAFLAVVVQKWLAGDTGVTVSGLVRTFGAHSDAAAGTAILAAAGALGVNLRRPGSAA
jgi:cobalamin biosynthesis protein CobD/CbiB